MRVLIFEPDHTGHHLHWVRLLVDGLRPLGVEIVVSLGGQAFGSPEYKTHLAQFENEIRFDSMPPLMPDKPWRLMRWNTRCFADTMKRVAPDHVLIPYGDGLAQGIGIARIFGHDLLADAIGEVLLMRGAYAYPISRLSQSIAQRASLEAIGMGSWSVVHYLDPIPFEYVQRRGGDLARRGRLMPDPVEPAPRVSTAQARAALGIPTDGRYIGCVGLIDGRKGADTLIKAFAEADLAPNDRLLLCGKHSDPVREMLSGAYKPLRDAGRVISFDQYVSQEQLLNAVSALDIMCTPYPRHIGSASILNRAAAAGKFVLGSNWGLIGLTISRFGLGLACDCTNVGELSAAVAVAMDRAMNYVPGEPARRFVEYNTIENFHACWTRGIRRRLGLPPSPMLRTWQWVLESAEPSGRS